MVKRIHVNQHHIRANTKNEVQLPVLTVKQGKDNNYANMIDILDQEGRVIARVVYRPDKPLSCGARVWIETEAVLVLHQKTISR